MLVHNLGTARLGEGLESIVLKMKICIELQKY